MPTESELRDQLKRYSAVLDARISEATTLESYYDGDHPYPPLVQESEVKKAYRMLQRLAPTNWPQSIIDAAVSKLEVQGVRFGDKAADKEVWELWQENGLDAESSVLHQSVLTTGRGYAVVWGDGTADPQPFVTYEHCTMCVVEFEPGSRRKRRGALRRWRDGGRWYANLYRPESVYKFKAETAGEDPPYQPSGWVRNETDEPWPLPNPLDEVPVVEFAVNRTLRPAPFGTARGDYARNLPHIDRINYKVFSGLVALTWSGFPLRFVIGDPIFYEKNPETGEDDKSKPIPPFDALASAVAQFTNPEAKVGQLAEANVSNYSAKDDIVELAAVTSTPLFHLLPGEMININADAMRAGQDSHVAKVRRHQRSLGESHEDVARLMIRVKDPEDPRGYDAGAEIDWRPAEERSLAEKADAYTKLSDLPWQVKAAMVLGMTPREISRAEAEGAGQVLDEIARQMNGDGVPAG